MGAQLMAWRLTLALALACVLAAAVRLPLRAGTGGHEDLPLRAIAEKKGIMMGAAANYYALTSSTDTQYRSVRLPRRQGSARARALTHARKRSCWRSSTTSSRPRMRSSGRVCTRRSRRTTLSRATTLWTLPKRPRRA